MGEIRTFRSQKEAFRVSDSGRAKEVVGGALPVSAIPHKQSQAGDGFSALLRNDEGLIRGIGSLLKPFGLNEPLPRVGSRLCRLPGDKRKRYAQREFFRF